MKLLPGAQYRKCHNPFTRIPRLATAFILAAILLLFNRSVASAFPPLPAAYYGEITVNGVNAPIGAEVTAWINGVRYGSYKITLYNGKSVYALVVAGDDLSTPQIEGGRPDDRIVFRLGSLQADQFARWSQGDNSQLNLSMVDDPTIIPRLRFPLVVKR